MIARELGRTHAELIGGGGPFVPISHRELVWQKALRHVEGDKRAERAKEQKDAAEAARKRVKRG